MRNVKAVHISSTPLTQRSWKVAWPDTFCAAKVAATHMSVDFMLDELVPNRIQNTAKLENSREEPGGGRHVKTSMPKTWGKDHKGVMYQIVPISAGVI